MKKTTLFYSILFFLLIVSAFLIYKRNSNIPIPSFKPILNNESIDLNGDGTKDIINVTEKKVELKINNSSYLINSYLKEDSLSSSPKSWPIKVFTYNLGRQLSPELIIQSNVNKKSKISILSWNSCDYTVAYSDSKNIFGILGYNSNGTPKCYTLNSFEGNSSLSSFMIINNKALDISKYEKNIPGLDNVLTFINLIQTNYELDEIPDIFSASIPSSELSLLWNLDKEKKSYSFQDAFFYDSFVNNDGKVTSITWRLSFEQYIIGSNDNSKKELIIYIISELVDNNNFKISSIAF